MTNPPPPDNLSTYRAKRSADRSPEPVGTVSAVPGRLFVVHKHAARQLHFDLRLEMQGVLRSWAVPRGPSYDMKDKRLAVKVEDHPLEYGDFEGIIPAGNYGAGGVIVWDRGEWIPLEDPLQGLEKGTLKFELKGYKLHGKWTLVKIKKSEKDWLLIKERDSYVKQPGDVFPEESVLSGLTVEELKSGHTPAGALRAALTAAGVPRARLDPKHIELMLAEPRDKAFTSDEWIFELKLDGYRLLASKAHGEALLLTRNGNDYTHVFPEIARAVKALPLESCIIDGEVVVLGADGTPTFNGLQRRGMLSAQHDVARAAVELPASFFAFDFLAFEDFDLRPLPLLQRKLLLAEALPKLGAVRYLDHVEREGEAFLEQVGTIGLEGIIAKKADAPYRAGRSSQWLKIKQEPTGDFVIVGFTDAKGSRGGFGALQIADYVNGTLVYAGRVGTGFDEKLLEQIRDMLDDIVRANPACEGPVGGPDAEPLPSEAIPDPKTTTWVDPVYVCEVRFREWTPDNVLRHPAFVRLRDDKLPHECERQWSNRRDGRDMGQGTGDQGKPQRDEPVPRPAAPTTRTVTFSNLSKIYWPEERYTKGDMIDYYRAIAPWLLPYLANRPVVLTRFPDGIEGKSFYQKDAPDFVPEWIRTIPIWSEDTQRDIKYFVADDVETLLYIANSGSIPLHIWSSRIGSLELADWCVLDLDPKDAPFSVVVRSAQVLHGICDSIGMPNYVKTTGKSGLHILVPLGRQFTYEQSRTLGELLARLALRELKDVATITRQVQRRGDKMYIDFLQNRRGQLIVSPFSVRPLPGATVSMPLLWEEVVDGLDPRAFTIKTAVQRMERMGEDPMAAVLEDKPDVAAALEKLAGLMA